MGEKIINTRIKHRFDTEANWRSNDPVLLEGELAFSSDTIGKFKIGNGTSKWSELQYAFSNELSNIGKIGNGNIVGTSPITASISNGVATISHSNSGITAGTYRSVTVDAKGHITAGTNPTTLSGYGITDAASKNHTHSYLPLSGGAMSGTAFISWPDTGNWSNSNSGVTFPVQRGGLSWSGQSDGVKLFAEETGNDNLELILHFTDDNSNGLTIRNKDGNQAARITAAGLFTGSFQGNLSGNVTGNVTGSSGSCTGNAATATKLQSARTINGTSFDGSSNITTANWGTSRNFTIANATKSVNGGSNVTFTAADLALKNSDILPIASKTFTGIYASENNFANGTFYFGSLKPETFYKEWHIKYRIASIVPSQNNYTGHFEVELWGSQNARTIYKITNAHYSTGYRTLYYHVLYSLKSAGFSNGYGHAIGIGLRNSTNPTSSSYPRTFKIDILETDNCTFTFYDAMTKYASIPGTGSTNYDGYSEYDGYNNGLRESGDDNNYNLTHYNIRVTAGTNGIYGTQLIMKDSSGKYQSLTLSRDTGTSKSRNTTGFIPGSLFYYSSGTTKSNGSVIDSWTIHECADIDFRYSSNCGTTLTAYSDIYLKGTISNGLFYLAETWWTQTLPTSDDGYVYIYMGNAYSTSSVRVVAKHPIYHYKNGSICEYNALAIKSVQDSAGQQINTTYIKGLSVSGKTITYTKGDGSTGTITTQDTNTTYSTGTASASGLTKLYTGTGTGTDGTMTQKAITDALGGKSPTSHTHNYAGSSSAGGAANSVANSIVVKLNGGSTEGTNLFTFNGSAAKTINITPSSIGAAASSHGTHVTYATDAPKANGTAAAGSSSALSRGDHVHPLQTSVSGNAGTATKLQTARKIGNASFDGTQDITLASMGIINPIELTKAEFEAKKSAGTLDMTAYYNITDDYDAAAIINDSAVASNQVFSSTKTESTYSKKSTVVDATLAAASWSGTVAPYTYTLSVSGVTATSVNEISYKYSDTDIQIKAYQDALLRDGGQSAGKITLKAVGTKPTVDIPITIIVRHDV